MIIDFNSKEEAIVKYNELKKIAEKMYSAINYLSIDSSRLMQSARDYYSYINFKENGTIVFDELLKKNKNEHNK